MNRDRTTWLLIGMFLTAVAAVALTAISLVGFATAPSGDLMVSSTARTTNMLLAIGAAAFLALEVRMHRPARQATAHADHSVRK
jgi:hypothetical protein